MEIMRGTFTGIGVGPGDPELLTLKAARLIRECHVAAVPVSDPGLTGPVCEEAERLSSDSSCAAYLEKCAAYQIALRAVPELASKPKLFLPMPMIKDKAVLKEIHDRDASAAAELLDEGRNIVFLTLGDPTVYSTCMYVHKRLARAGYPTALVPGIPSFCAAAARLDMPLAENREEIHILPASYGIKESLRLPGTKILMKAGREKDGRKDGPELRHGRRADIQQCGRDPGAGGVLLTAYRERGKRRRKEMITFVGAGPGAEDLITVRGQRLLQDADIVVYAGSLVNPGLLSLCREDCQVYNSAKMTLEEVLDVMTEGERERKRIVRLHTGDPCLYGAIREQMDALEAQGIPYEVCPGVSSFCGAAAALGAEYTLPGISQSVVITRMAGRTPVPEKESIASFAAHQATMVVFLSTGMLKELSAELIRGGYPADTPAAIVYKATWPEEKVLRCTVETLEETAREEGVTKTALIVVGRILEGEYERSKLYDPAFTTEFRQASAVPDGDQRKEGQQ